MDCMTCCGWKNHKQIGAGTFICVCDPTQQLRAVERGVKVMWKKRAKSCPLETACPVFLLNVFQASILSPSFINFTSPFCGPPWSISFVPGWHACISFGSVAHTDVQTTPTNSQHSISETTAAIIIQGTETVQASPTFFVSHPTRAQTHPKQHKNKTKKACPLFDNAEKNGPLSKTRHEGNKNNHHIGNRRVWSSQLYPYVSVYDCHRYMEPCWIFSNILQFEGGKTQLRRNIPCWFMARRVLGYEMETV